MSSAVSAPDSAPPSSCVTIPSAALGRHIGWLLPEQEPALTAALHAAFDLEDLADLR